MSMMRAQPQVVLPSRQAAGVSAVPVGHVRTRVSRSLQVSRAPQQRRVAYPAGPSRHVCAAAKEGAPPPPWKLAMAELDKPKGTPGRKCCVVQIAPAPRVAISECYGLPPGTITCNQMVTALKMLGFDFVFDMAFSADLTIMEEGAELLHRLKENLEGKKEHPMPMFTSCCPGWVAMVEKSYPEMIPFLSSAKSPQAMMGGVLRTYFSHIHNVKPADVMSACISPCVRKQGEADRPWFETEGARDVDFVIVTTELATICKERNIDLPNLPETEPDNPIGEGSGGGVLFGTTGGVMESALRNVYEMVCEEPMGRIKFQEARGMDGLKEAKITMKPSPKSPFAKFAKGDEGITLNIAVAHGLGNAKKVVMAHKGGKGTKYDFVEVMACPGGCIGGGGQPRSMDKQILAKRQEAMYSIDERLTVRRPLDNPFIQKLYKEYMGEPLGDRAHHILHTHFVAGGPEESK